MSINYGPVFSSPAVLRMDNDVKFYPYNVLAETHKETGKVTKYTVEIALAGIKKSDISVRIDDEGGLEIKVTPTKKELSEEIKLLRNGISYSNRSITFELPKEINIKSVTSKYEDGLLTIELPLIVEKSKSRNITIG